MVNAAFPETEESEESRAGTAAHWVSDQLIHGSTAANRPKRETLVGSDAPNGVIIDDEMFDAAELYADDVAEVMRSERIFGGPNFGTEVRVRAPQVHAKNFGTLDQFIFSERAGKGDARFLYIWDFKFGYRIVEPFENWQLINYYAGLVNELQIIDDENLTVVFRVVQPRAPHRFGPVREWRVKASDLRAYVNRLFAAAADAMGRNPKAKSGKHCLYCPGRHACEAALNASLSAIEYSTSPVPLAIGNEAIGRELALLDRMINAVQLRRDGLAEVASAKIRSGERVPGYVLQDKRGRTKWRIPAEQVIALCKLSDDSIDVAKPVDTITPKQAIKKGLDADFVNGLVETPMTGTELTADNGDRVRVIFSKYP